VGSRDLDQAIHLTRDSNGFLLRYAIADVPAFVDPGGPLDEETAARGETVYFPDRRLPLHPFVLSEEAASLLPDAVRPAAVWTVRLDADASPLDVRVERALVRSRAQLAYPEVQAMIDGDGALPEALSALAGFGAARSSQVLARGGLDLDQPSQEVEHDGNGGWRLVLRAPLPAERYNAQISLLTGECAAGLMLAAGVGLLRTLPPAPAADVGRLRAAAPGLGIEWPGGTSPGRVVASVDRADPRGAAFLDLAASLLRGAGYTAFDGAPPAQPLHAGVGAPYAHVTAPLRRLVDRYATEVCLAVHAGTAIPLWARNALPGLPALAQASGQRASAAERAVIDLVEAVVLADQVGTEFDVAVIDTARGRDGTSKATVALDDPPVRARCTGTDLRAGERIRARLVEADPTTRTVRFAAV
jgi:exoribonuclease R